ncbi:ABC transporter permease [Ancylomarina euxinus]|uniref:ABC transporter permease n=1 Tax=Ancylomarina euxinus TaxID=2283627 RepID=A0A425Y7N0_9BACT|nr:ABC transporter permease [Ancylomarina euxinus]MCZ4693642.1 ABC transporter permease [Ancylomarina euxinus]MUP13870.1 FtsX-like permease family protein [Ancylomarina euxinus]RRG24500.1 ABC transporter permease [Ancylomarina euxinus]
MNKIKTYIRVFFRDKVSLLLGVGSLTIGISVSLLIGLWYVNETSYDKFHKDSDNTYRVCRKILLGSESKILGSEFNPLGKNIKRLFPEVIEAVRISPIISEKGELVKYGGKKHFLKYINVVDTSFFNFFNYEFKEGSAHAFIQNPNSIIIDETTANQFFPNENPLGRVISYMGEREVVGVLKNLPSNTHLKFHALIPIQSIPEIDNGKWGNRDNYMTYVKLAKDTNQAFLCEKIKQYSVTSCDFYREGDIDYFLQPLQAIHLTSGFMFEAESGVRTTNASMLVTFLIIGIVILLIACVNFINLFISASFLRAKAIGLKKVNGAKRLNIIMDFMGETFLYVFFSSVLALLIIHAVLPYFSQFIGYNLLLDFSDSKLWIMLLGVGLFISIFSGAIPGLYMSGFNSLESLKGRFKGQRIIALQKSLVIIQFTVSMALLTGVFFINKQIQFINNADLGFDKEQLVYINIPESYVNKISSIQEELERSPFVKATCVSNGTTLQWWQGNSISKAETPDEQVVAEIKQMQHNYFKVYGLQVIEGENTLSDALGKGFGSDCLINEKTAELLNLEKPYIGKSIKVGFRKPMTIVGVVKDAYTKSLNQKIDPQVYVRFCDIWAGMPLMVKTTGRDMKVVIDILRKQWEANETDYPFEYRFLDKDYEALYKDEEQSGILALWTMGIALFLTIAGLWGMARYSSHRRIKEIGVRKVNGASTLEILRLLNTDFIKWVVVAFSIACPIAWYVMDKWLQNFAYKTELSWWIFALSGLIGMGIALLTVSIQSWRAATRNPVESLRYE